MLTKNSYDVRHTFRLVPQDQDRPTFSVDDSGEVLTITSGDFSATFTREEALRIAGFIERYCKATPSFFANWVPKKDSWVQKTGSCYALEC